MNERFYVYMIESPSPRDLLDQGLEGYVLTQALRLSSIECVYHVAANHQAFTECLYGRFDAAMRVDGYRRIPALHFECSRQPAGHRYQRASSFRGQSYSIG